MVDITMSMGSLSRTWSLSSDYFARMKAAHGDGLVTHDEQGDPVPPSEEQVFDHIAGGFIQGLIDVTRYHELSAARRAADLLVTDIAIELANGGEE